MADDARLTLARVVRERGETLGGLSRRLGRNAAYLQQYLTRHSPRVLPERERRWLADYLRIDETLIGGPPAPPGPVRVPRIDARAAAGAGAVGDDARLGDMLLDPALIAALGRPVAYLSVIRARGDSMLPTIADGDRLLVDTSDRRIDRTGGVFVLRRDGLLLVKRLRMERGGIAIVSDNPAYAIETIRDPDMVGRVVWLSRTL